MTSATVAAATANVTAATTSVAATTEASTAAAGGAEARISVIAVHSRRSAVSNAAENVAARGRRTFRNSSITHSLGSGWRVGASHLRRSGGATCLEILARGTAIPISYRGV